MDRESFWRVHDMIVDDDIFKSSNPRSPQRPVRFQLAAFFCRMGSETAVKTAGFVAVSEGSVYNFSYRVVRAIRRHRDEFVSWPSEAQRDETAPLWARAGFPGGTGSADGTYFKLEDKPHVNGYAYYCHKRFYAVSNSFRSHR